MNPTYYTSRLEVDGGQRVSAGSSALKFTVEVESIQSFNSDTSEYSEPLVTAIADSVLDTSVAGQLTCTGALKEIEYTVLITPNGSHLDIAQVIARVVIEDVV